MGEFLCQNGLSFLIDLHIWKFIRTFARKITHNYGKKESFRNMDHGGSRSDD